MNCVMTKPAFCIFKNKGADQLRGNRRAADQHLCFRFIDNKIHLLHESEISSIKQSFLSVQPESCRSRSETLKMGLLTTQLSL